MIEKHIAHESAETISAVTTALGEGAVGIIRISGSEAAAIGNRLFQAASGKKLTEPPVPFVGLRTCGGRKC